MQERACPYCGKPIGATLNRCPFCREAISQAQLTSRSGGGTHGRANLRRGLLWALLAGVIYYFAGGHSGLTIPFEVPGFVNIYLTPLLFVAGAALAVYGLFQQMKA